MIANEIKQNRAVTIDGIACDTRNTNYQGKYVGSVYMPILDNEISGKDFLTIIHEKCNVSWETIAKEYIKGHAVTLQATLRAAATDKWSEALTAQYWKQLTPDDFATKDYNGLIAKCKSLWETDKAAGNGKQSYTWPGGPLSGPQE